MNNLVVALFQANADIATPTQRLTSLSMAIRNAKEQAADIIICPELYSTGYHSDLDYQAIAEPGDGAFFTAVQNLAKREKIAIVYGYPEKDGALIFNSAIVIDMHGNTLQHYRKCYLPKGFEQGAFTAGNQISSFKLKGTICSCIICYDLEFPEMSRQLAQAGVELIIVPTALKGQWRFVAEKLVPVRAFENGIFIAYVNYAQATSQDGFAGLSCLIGPNGKEILRGGSIPEVLTANINVSSELKTQRQIKYLNHLRSDITYK